MLLSPAQARSGVIACASSPLTIAFNDSSVWSMCACHVCHAPVCVRVRVCACACWKGGNARAQARLREGARAQAAPLTPLLLPLPLLPLLLLLAHGSAVRGARLKVGTSRLQGGAVARGAAAGRAHHRAHA